jgi:hypothetical protein
MTFYMSASLQIYAGEKALATIKKEGLNPDLFNAMAGASGGPKWFTLFGLDKYLFGEFFANRSEPLYTIGSSAGAWRMACFAQNDPVAAITRLAHYYANTTYSAKPDVNEISDKAEVMLQQVLGETGAQEIAQNSMIQTHLIVARAKGLNASENKLLQLLGLLTAAVANGFSRKTLPYFFDRYIFSTQNAAFLSSYFQPNDLPTFFAPLSPDNVHSTLMASGAIPLVLRGVQEIPNAPKGIYRDGGIVDYHLDIDFSVGENTRDKLVLYPHFFPSIKPGWFDKKLKSRNALISNYDNVVVVTPSASHVAQLPFQKISDRTDFEKLDSDPRIKYWQTVLDESHRLAEDFNRMVDTGEGLQNIIPISQIL